MFDAATHALRGDVLQKRPWGDIALTSRVDHHEQTPSMLMLFHAECTPCMIKEWLRKGCGQGHVVVPACILPTCILSLGIVGHVCPWVNIGWMFLGDGHVCCWNFGGEVRNSLFPGGGMHSLRWWICQRRTRRWKATASTARSRRCLPARLGGSRQCGGDLASFPRVVLAFAFSFVFVLALAGL
eukprot:6492025-Amphidinium_carterae.1